MVTEKMIEALKPCPFCGGSDVHLRHHQANQMSWVSCVGCGLEAPSETGVSDDDAVNYWNRRDEAALLTDAEPVAWVDEQELRYLEMVTGNKGWGDAQRNIKVGGKNEGRAPLYAAPPAPSVAVNAFPSIQGFGASFNRDEDAWILYTTPTCERFGQIDGFSPPRIDWVLSVLRAALSAQVQDVAEDPQKRMEELEDRAANLFDKVEGLEADLDSAVEVAFKHGATDWVRLNYSSHYARLSAAPAAKLEEKP